MRKLFEKIDYFVAKYYNGMVVKNILDIKKRKIIRVCEKELLFIMKKWLVMFLALLLLMSITGCVGESKDKSVAENPESSTTAESGEESYIKFPEFESVTIAGDSIDASIFAEAEVTMVNIWGTFCGPCINEMPDLAELYEELPEECALVGVLTDVYTDENMEIINLDTAIQIVEETGVTYNNIIPDAVLFQFLAENITGVPTTLYVDSKGNILGGVVGARSKDEYKAILEELIKE